MVVMANVEIASVPLPGSSLPSTPCQPHISYCSFSLRFSRVGPLVQAFPRLGPHTQWSREYLWAQEVGKGRVPTLRLTQRPACRCGE